MVKKILLGLGVVFIVLQFFRIDKENPVADPSLDFMELTSPPVEVATILKTACYDCHSYKTEYPWYTNVAPVSWWIADHINHGRGELNFSEWANYSYKRADHKLEEGVEMVEDLEMPLPSYTWAHGDARLSDAQRELLIDWFSDLRTEMKEAQEQDHEEGDSDNEKEEGEGHDN